jgi:predicted metalloprotease
MKWSGRKQSDNVIDRRESSGAGMPTSSRGTGPKLGLGGVVALGLVVYFLGGVKFPTNH